MPCLFNLFSIEHREHGNRIMHEFLLGQENIKRDLPPRGKTSEYDKSVIVILLLCLITGFVFIVHYEKIV